MFAHPLLPFLLLLLARLTNAAAPTVSLPYGTFRGFESGNLTQFLGVPFAQAGRFENPRIPAHLHGIQNATEFGPACPQQSLTPQDVFYTGPSYPSISEDCLTLNIFKPKLLEGSKKLPVFVWIYGGGFQLGNSRDVDVTPMLRRSIETKEPVIIVTPNYRVSAFGFLAGKEVAAAGISNLGFRDQIFALKWVQKHISAFGGDPSRVVIGGQSAGSMSLSFLALYNKHDSHELFHGLVQQSGPAIHIPSLADGQADYDALVESHDCASSADTLNCLREVPFESLMASVNKTSNFFSYRSLNLTWLPRIDGDVVQRDPFASISQGLYAKVPVMSGMNDDEGTLFSYSTLNITSAEEFLDYVHFNLLPASSANEIQKLRRLYPQDSTQGSPFNTGAAYELTPQYKRISAFQGDLEITAPRRLFLEHASQTQNVWGWLNKRGKTASALGAYHGSDILIWFPPDLSSETSMGVDAIVNFINTLNPNVPAKHSSANIAIYWPKWNTVSEEGSKPVLTFFFDSGINITAENFREEQVQFLNSLRLEEAGVSL
ncbi:carboxylic ester hydrolase [Favolaschia claudopus]|uniref:Carboxylic ester hydrolase n=1 Tax=Favolaschia claudopus TaxID=2862362 RepID=A0AAW0DP68_9AGAR